MYIKDCGRAEVGSHFSYLVTPWELLKAVVDTWQMFEGKNSQISLIHILLSNKDHLFIF